MDSLQVNCPQLGVQTGMQTTDHVLMVRPVHFSSNLQTAMSNVFQHCDLNAASAQTAAREEFDRYVELLQEAGVGVLVVEDTPAPYTPDSIFPNNWVSFGADGRVFLYPMEAPNRRLERRPAILEEISRHFLVREIVDMSSLEKEGKFLEGTGSMVMDHMARRVYVCHSSRSHHAAIQMYEHLSGYSAYCFHAEDEKARPIYHTNVMMTVGSHFAVVCLEAIKNNREHEALLTALESSGKHVIAITFDQVKQFAANMIELRSVRGQSIVAMSRRAWHCLSHAQRKDIQRHAEPVVAPLDTIERLGGGGARCMVAEIFLARRA